MKVKLTQPIVSLEKAYDVGDEYPCASKDEAERLDAAVAKTILEGKARTYDMGGSSTTLELAEKRRQLFPLFCRS